MKLALMLPTISAFIIYLLFCFGNAGFDIQMWSVDGRGACAVFMALAVVFGVFLAGQKDLLDGR